MNILGIESSCDETGVAWVSYQGSEPPVLLAHALHSQVQMHEAYGGVVPELASRDHIRRAVPLTREVIRAVGLRSGLDVSDLDGVAYTRGPGLAGALLVGAGMACALAYALGKPAWGVHHLEGHLLSPFLSVDPPEFPFVALLVSGGHTQLMRVEDVGQYQLLGESIDDAAGEAFDKSAQLLGLGYPGGPALSKLALQGDPKRYALPRPLLHSGDGNFSFAGLKTAVRTQVVKWGAALPGELARAGEPAQGCASAQDRADLAASTQEAIVDVLVHKSVWAMKQTGLRRLVVAGGVGANARLRERLNAEGGRRAWRVHYPELALCTDNGAMIALAAALRLQRGAPLAGGYDFQVQPRWPLL
jgi:N6-L-threonylcarbamoyladenine synthase